MACNNCGCAAHVEPCRIPQPSELGIVQWVEGLDASGCPRYQPLADFVSGIYNVFTSILCGAIFSPLPPVAILGRDTMGNCPVYFTPAQILAGSLSVVDTRSIDLTLTPGGVLSANLIDQYARDLFCATDTATVDMSYDPLTGCFSAVIDPNALVTGALCAALAALPLGGFQYGITQLVGPDCQVHVVSPQLLAFNPGTGQLSISDGNTVIIPDLHIVNFLIAGNIATIVRSDGALFQATIPLTLDINVASFSLSGGILTITETDGSVHNVVMPVDCCPVSLSIVAGNLTLVLSNGTTLTTPMPVEVTLASVSVAGNILTITETNGAVWTGTLPQYNVTSSNGSINVVTIPGPGNLTTFDLLVNFPPEPPVNCAEVIACLTEGQNIDITPGGVISAGFLRDNGGGCYSWINQDGTVIYSFCLGGSAFNLCASIAALPVGAPAGAGQSINVLGADCQIHQINIPAGGAGLCAQILALPAVQLRTNFLIPTTDGAVCSNAFIGAAVNCIIPAQLMGSDAGGNVSMFTVGSLPNGAVAVTTGEIIVGTGPGGAVYTGNLAKTAFGGVAVLNLPSDPCRDMRYQVTLHYAINAAVAQRTNGASAGTFQAVARSWVDTNAPGYFLSRSVVQQTQLNMQQHAPISPISNSGHWTSKTFVFTVPAAAAPFAFAAQCAHEVTLAAGDVEVTIDGIISRIDAVGVPA